MTRTVAPSILIIGAPRSGTNMLRDILTSLPGLGTWPCDEINYIWRHGNIRFPSDEFTREMATPPVVHSIRRHFQRIADRYDLRVVVEKTCANSLRVEFVDSVLPDSKYIFIRRDGLDAVGSALKCWRAPLNVPYLARKARFVPVTDLPYYATRYLWNRVYRLFSKERRLAMWGPRLSDMDDLLARYSLEEVCALQWKRCDDRAGDAFSRMNGDRFIEVSYEDFVCRPFAQLQRITEFLGTDVSESGLRTLVSGVSDSSIGKGRAYLGDEVIARLTPLLK